MKSEKIFVFLSTLEHIPWGGCEELWRKTALVALENNHKVYIVVFKHDEIPPYLIHLQDKGAKIFFLKRNHTCINLLRKIENKIRPEYKNKKILRLLKNELDSLSSDVVILISQAGGFDFAYSYLDIVREWLLTNRFNYHIVVQNVPDLGLTLSISAAQKQIDVYQKSCSIGFVSERNLISSERILAMHIKKGYIINNPLNFNDIPSYLPPPEENVTIQLAVVAALRCNHKGQDVLFQVLSEKVWRERNWVLNLYGKGSDEEYLKKLGKFYNIDHKIFYYGHVDDIKKIWERNHIHILPSLGEGTPLALIESMVCGRAAITTDVGGNAEYITHMESGFVGDYPTYPALKKIIELAWQNQNHWISMGKKARDKIIMSYDLIPQLTLYNILVAKSSPWKS
ncbi:MAG: glycosyltransferase [Saprospiraceae bacterium]